MSYLAEPPRSDEADILYDADRASLGYVANYSKVFARRPQVYRAWKELNGAVKATMDPVRYEVATVAAARELRVPFRHETRHDSKTISDFFSRGFK